MLFGIRFTKSLKHKEKTQQLECMWILKQTLSCFGIKLHQDVTQTDAQVAISRLPDEGSIPKCYKDCF